MTIKRITDRYNSQKIWIIKRYADGHYYLNQEICGRKSHGFVRSQKWYIKQVIDWMEI